jgi:hypothetical protein
LNLGRRINGSIEEPLNLEILTRIEKKLNHLKNLGIIESAEWVVVCKNNSE